jgi:prophage DNA circulation protein
MTKPNQKFDMQERESKLVAIVGALQSERDAARDEVEALRIGLSAAEGERDLALQKVDTLQRACAAARAAMMRYRSALSHQSTALLKLSDAEDEGRDFDGWCRHVSVNEELPF